MTSHRRRLSAVLALLPLAVLTAYSHPSSAVATPRPPTGVVSTTGTATNGPLSINAETQFVRRNCVDYPIGYAVATPAGQEWELDLSVQLPNGDEADADYEYGSAPVSASMNAFLCDSLEGAGTYTVVATLVLRNDLYQPVGTYEARTTWTLVKGASQTTVRLSKSVVNRGGTVTIRGRVTGKTGPYAGVSAGSVDVKLQYRLAGTTRWHRIGTVTADRYGHYAARRVPVTTRARAAYVRAKFAGDDVLTRSTSPQAKLRVLQ